MSKFPLLGVLLLITAQASVAFVSRSLDHYLTSSSLVACTELSSHRSSLLVSSGRPMQYHRFIKSVFQLRASSIDRDADSSISATTTTQNNAEPPTTDLKELASRIDKNKSSRGLLVRGDQETSKSASSRPRYQLGVGKNLPVAVSTDSSSNNSSSNNNNNITAVLEQKEDILSAAMNWNVPQPATKKQQERQRYDMGLGKHSPISNTKLNDDDRGDTSNNGYGMRTTMRLLPNRGEESARLTKAVWDEGHFVDDDSSTSLYFNDGSERGLLASSSNNRYKQRFVPSTQQQRLQQQQQQDQQDQQQNDVITDYRQIDLSIPPSVYSLGSSSSSPTSSSNSTSTINGVDLVWDLMRQEAQAEAAREPLLVSFLYSTILNHPTLESALSFHLANRLSSPAMLSTQIMSLIQEALDADPNYRISLRADILAVRDRDPACHCLPDVFLYFKGFHALQTYRAAHYLWTSGRRVLAHYLQSQVSQHFQIDIHPNATLGSGIMLDHGTGIVIGETAHVGHNCSVLHHVTLGGSGKKGNDRHPKIGNGVLLGAGASVLGNIHIGDGCQVGAGTLVIDDLPPRSVAVGVPAKIIGRFVDVTAQPSIGMNQLGSKEAEKDIYMFGMDGI